MLELQDSSQHLREQLFEVGDEIEVYTQEHALILANGKLGGSEQGVEPEKLRQMADLHRSRLTEIKTRLRSPSAKRKKDLDKQLNAFTHELTQIYAKRNSPTQQVVVAFKADRAGELRLELSYLVRDAGWDPFYTIRVNNTDQPMDMQLKANLINNTGVGWEDVSLTLSTAINSGNNQSPILTPRYLDIRSISRRDISSPKSQSERLLSNTMNLQAAAPPGKDKVRLPTQLTTLTQTELAIEFEIALPYDIPADNQPHQVDIKNLETKGRYEHYAVPKLDPDAFLVAYLQTDLLRGKAHVYFEGAFVGETYVNTDNPADSMKISLGRDPNVQINHKQVSDFTRIKQLGSTIKQSYAYEMVIRNNKRQTVTLNLEDQIPVSRNKDIKVELVENGGAKHDEESGRLYWELTLAPGETRKLRFVYEVKYPKGKPVYGLE